MKPEYKNTVILLGIIGAEVERRDLATGKVLATVSLATSETRQFPDGAEEKITTWHNLIAWGDIAEGMCKLKKGTQVYVEGKLQYRTYETKSGEKRYQTEIQVIHFKEMRDPNAEKPSYWYFELIEQNGERQYTIKRVFKGTQAELEEEMKEKAGNWYPLAGEAEWDEEQDAYSHDCGEVLISLGESRIIPQYHYSVLKNYLR